MLLTRRVEYYEPPHCHTTTLITRPGPSHLLNTLHRTVTHTPCPAKCFRQYSSNRLNSSIPRFTSPMPITTPLLVSPFVLNWSSGSGSASLDTTSSLAWPRTDRQLNEGRGRWLQVKNVHWVLSCKVGRWRKHALGFSERFGREIAISIVLRL